MSRYDDYPDHPLCGFPESVLEVARESLQGAVEWGDISEDMRDPIADAMVMALLPWIDTSRVVIADDPEPCPGECEDGWVILNPDWPNGELPYREKCSYVGDDEYRVSHPTFWGTRR